MSRDYAPNPARVQEMVTVRSYNALMVESETAAADHAELLEICGHLRLDLEAESADPAKLPFMAPPPGAPPYHGFEVLDIEVEGFRLGLISDPFGDPVARQGGDGFVVAPDGSRAGLVWKLDEPFVFRTVDDTAQRWGVWLAGIGEPIEDRDSARRVLSQLVEQLRPHWEAWAAG